jgi:hypothetical protein
MSNASATSPFRGDPQSAERYQPERYPPFVALPGLTRRELAETPNVGYFTVPAPSEKVIKSYRVRVRRPKFPWVALVSWTVLVLGLGGAVLAAAVFQAESTLLSILGAMGLFVVAIFPVPAAFFLFRQRGHSLLYLTNQRVMVVDLGQGLLRRYQSVMSYDLRHVAGFTLHAQRGLKKLLYLILLKEKRTFYLRFITPHHTFYEIGAVNTWRSQFEPGLDAVALCAELDALVLSLKSAMPPK